MDHSQTNELESLVLINTSLDEIHVMESAWFQQYFNYPLFHILLIARNQIVFRKVLHEEYV